MISEKLTTLIVVLNFGSLILLSFLNFANPLNVNRIANRWFGAFLLIWAGFWIDEIMLLIFGINLNTLWHFIFRYIQYFAPILFYYSVVKYSNPGFRIKKVIFYHLILPVVYFIILYYYYFGGYQLIKINYLLIILMLSQTLYYSLASYIRIRKHKKAILLFLSQTGEVDLTWLERIIAVLFLIIIMVIFYNIAFSLESLNLFMNLIILLVIFDVAFHSMKQKEIFPFSNASREEIISLNEESDIEEIKKKIVSDEELVQLKSQLNQFMINRKIYLDPDLNLVKLADMFATNPHRLSYIINSGFNKNFFNFINYYRVEEAKSLLLNPKMDQYSILGIAFESGFNSKTSFNNTFKKITGLTPTDFKKSGSTL